jgi:hypothetical protein
VYMKDPLKFRRKYQSTIVDLSQQVDQVSRRLMTSGSASDLIEYHRLVDEICSLKEWIISKEL